MSGDGSFQGGHVTVKSSHLLPDLSSRLKVTCVTSQSGVFEPQFMPTMNDNENTHHLENPAIDTQLTTRLENVFRAQWAVVIILEYNFGSSPSDPCNMQHVHLITHCQSIDYIAFQNSAASDVPAVEYMLRKVLSNIYNVLATRHHQ